MKQVLALAAAVALGLFGIKVLNELQMTRAYVRQAVALERLADRFAPAP